MKRTKLMFIMANLLGGFCLLQLPAKNGIGTHNSIWTDYGFPFTFFTRNWHCDWYKGWQHASDAEIRYISEFSYLGLLGDITIVLFAITAGYFILKKVSMNKSAWGISTGYVYIASSLALLVINLYFIIQHTANTQTMKSGRFESGWPMPIWSDFLGIVNYANVWNALVFIFIPLLLALLFCICRGCIQVYFRKAFLITHQNRRNQL